MVENNQQGLPSFASLDDLVDFFDANDMGNYEADLPEAYFEVNLQKRTYLVAIDREVNSELTKIAEQEQVPAEALVNLWLREKISTYSERT
jgi:hypothetical protein